MFTRRLVHVSGLLACAALALSGSSACSRASSVPADRTPVTSRGPAFTPPATTVRAVVDEYHGVKVTDPYRWLEDGASDEVNAWSDAQNAAARAYLDNLPGVDALREKITALETGASVGYAALEFRDRAAGTVAKLFALKTQPPRQQPMLVWMPCEDDPAPEQEFVIVDPNVLDSAGHTSIDWFVPSPDARLVAVSISVGGSESGDVRIYESDTGKQVDVVVPRVNGGTAGGSLAWAADGSGFYYTRYPRAGERPAEDMDFYTQVYYHALGTPTEQDRYETGADFPRIAEIQLESSRDGRFVLASVQKGDGGEFQHYVRTGNTRAAGTWSQLTRYSDECVYATLGDGAVYLVSNLSAPMGKVIRVPLSGSPGVTVADGRVVVPEGKGAIETDFMAHEGLWVAGNTLYVLYQTGGPNELHAFSTEGRSIGTVATLPLSSIDGVCVTRGSDVLLRNQSMLLPPAWYHHSAERQKTTKTGLFRTSPADYSDAEVVREWATSNDGTRVPMLVLRRKGTSLNGNNPALLWGYGGYGVCQSPTFSARHRVWLDRGGVFALAIIRGGGEFGETWHRQGNLANKQNVFDDFAACARRLIERGYTSPSRLALQGGSNGGLLMGALITQHPSLARAVVSSVGIYDMLRVELTPNGAFNVPEFGTVKDPALFRALHAYSPYHRVRDGTKYPAVLMMTGRNDPRVDPWHSRKMTARLQSAGAGGLPVLLRTDANAGHGIGSSLAQRIEMLVDMYAFLFHELGVPPV